MRKGLIFDLDGTLWDPTATSAMAWNMVIAGNNIDHRGVDEKDMFRISGMRPDQFLPLLFPFIEENARWRIYAEIASAEAELFLTKGGRILPGVEEGLLGLKDHFDLYIVSNCQEKYLDSFLEWSGFEGLIKDHESHGRTGLDKHLNIKGIMERNSVKDATYIGDTVSDRIAAGSAGVPFIQITHGIRPAIDGELCFDRFPDLVDHLLRTIP